MNARTPHNSALYLFEKFEVGVVHMDALRTVLAMNDFARKVLPIGEKQPFDKLVLFIWRYSAIRRWRGR